MENASKALIIAGAILLSILIIGLGMLIFNQAKNALGNTGIDKQKVRAYNESFLAYEGKKSGSDARQLCQDVIAHNLKAEDASEFIKVTYYDTSTGADSIATVTKNEYADTKKPSDADVNPAINAIKAKLSSGRLYKIVIGYDQNTGYVCQIGIALQN